MEVRDYRLEEVENEHLPFKKERNSRSGERRRRTEEVSAEWSVTWTEEDTGISSRSRASFGCTPRTRLSLAKLHAS